MDQMTARGATPGLALEPVLSLELVLGYPSEVGPVSNGGTLICVPLTGGSLKSIEGGLLSGLIDAELIHGLDISRADPDQKVTRLNVNAVYKNKDASVISLSYETLIRITGETRLIFMGAPEARSTDFGHMFSYMRFETGNTKLKALEENLFVASGRFIVAHAQPLTVEYKVCRLIDQ